MHLPELTRRHLLALAGVAVSTLALRGAVAAGAPAISAKDGSFDRVKSAGLLTFGTSNDEPFSFVDTKTGVIAGIDGEMLLAMLERLGIAKNQVLQVSFDGLIPSLMSSRIDMICDAMYITEKRKKVIDFTDPFYQYGETLMVPKGNPKGLHKLADLKGARAGAVLGTVYLDWVKEVEGAEAVSYDEPNALMQDLKIGRIDAALLDAPVVGFAMSKKPELASASEMVSDYTPKEVGMIGAGFRKEDAALLQAFNWALSDIKKDGTDLKILKKWGLGEINRVPAA